MRKEHGIILLILLLNLSCQLPGLDKFQIDFNTYLLLERNGLINTNSQGRISSITLSSSEPSYSVLRVTQPLILSTDPPDLPIFYTIDGSEPTINSLRYESNFYPNQIAPGKNIRAKSILETGVESNELNLRYLYPYLRSGQTSCYNFASDVLEPCDGTHLGQDGRLQKGTPIQYRSGITNSGFDNDLITIDEVLGIAWTTCRSGMSGASCNIGTPNAVTGENTNPEDICEQYNQLNSGSGYAGIQNWRLPTALELGSIALFQINPAVRFDPSAFPNLTTPLPLILHGERNPNIATQRFYYRVNDTFYGSIADTNTNATTCVSGQSQPTPEYTDLGDGTIRDELRGLVWTKCLAGQNLPNCPETPIGLNYLDSMNYCNNLTLAGRSWRLPNIRELDTLSNPKDATTPRIFGKNLFTPLIAGQVLRSSTTDQTVSQARRFTVNTPGFSGGGAAALKTDATVRVICVSDEEW
jgi:hypothetical protein